MRDQAKMALVPIESKPFNAETPLRVLTRSIMPTRLFFIRNHFDIPHVDERKWRLKIDGRVERALEFRLADLKNLPKRSYAVTLECAGNGRALMVPRPKGTPWGYGAVGTAQFVGTPLSELLKLVSPLHDAVEVLFSGADRGEVEQRGIEPFAHSLPLDEARNSGALLAWGMNGDRLPPEHGSPVRLIFPGWYGVASVKWLVRISLLSEPFKGYFQRKQYVYEKEQGTPEHTPVTRMRVRALIGRPTDGEKVKRGLVNVAGTAWSGFGPIRRVEVTVDGGHSWTDANLGTSRSSFACTPWHFRWDVEITGTYTLMARATDKAGNIQPIKPIWNANGYGNNGVHSVRIIVT